MTFQCSSLLGFWHDKTGKKELTFNQVFAALGAQLDLAGLLKGNFVLANKPGRVENIIWMLTAAVEQDSLSPACASVIQGHLTFASGFYMSKCLRFLNKAFGTALGECACDSLD